MPSRILLLVSLGLGVIPPVPSASPQRPGGPPSLPASSAKIETRTLAPSEAGRDFYVAPHGGHVAAISQKGSRFVVVHDGVTSPPFDEIVGANPKLRIIFSDDGARYAYVGRQGQEFVVMVDGKEANRLPVATTRWDFSARFPEFGPKGKHVYFVFRTKKGTERVLPPARRRRTARAGDLSHSEGAGLQPGRRTLRVRLGVRHRKRSLGAHRGWQAGRLPGQQSDLHGRRACTF